MAGNAAPYAVHSYHVNCGIGDAAIHLLVSGTSLPGDLTAPNKPTVLRAVLIDGGQYNTFNNKQKETLWTTVARINKAYQFADHGQPDTSPGKKTLRFDSIVITHMDKDHTGVIGKLAEDFQTNVLSSADFVAAKEIPYLDWQSEAVDFVKDANNNFDFDGITDNSTEDEIVEALGHADDMDFEDKEEFRSEVAFEMMKNVTNREDWWEQWQAPYAPFQKMVVQCNIMKYDNTLAMPPVTASATAPNPAVPTAALLTTMYVAYPVQNSDPNNKKIKPLLCPHSMKKHWLTSNANGNYTANTTNTANLNWNFEFQKQSPIPWPKKSKTNKIGAARPISDSRRPTYIKFGVMSMCKVVATAGEYLGVELFNYDARSVNASQASISSAAALIKSAGLTQSMGPRMWIVFGDQVVIGAQALAGPTTKALFMRPHEDIVDGGIPAGAKRSTNYADPAAVAKNSPIRNTKSICVLILASLVLDWTAPAAQVPLTNAFVKVLHYSAGDALWDVESSIAGWLPVSGDATPLLPAAVMKLSHHGASESTTQILLKTLNPRTIIASNPTGIAHPHPSPEVLIYLMAFFCVAFVTANNNPVLPRPLLCTAWPGYFERVKGMDLSYLTPAANVAATALVELAFVTALDKLFTKAALVTNPWAYWTEQTKLQPNGSPLQPLHVVKPTPAQKQQLWTFVASFLKTKIWPEVSSQIQTDVVDAWVMILPAVADPPIANHRRLGTNKTYSAAYPQNELTRVRSAIFPAPPAPIVIANVNVNAQSAAQAGQSKKKAQAMAANQPFAKKQKTKSNFVVRKGTVRDTVLVTSSPTPLVDDWSSDDESEDDSPVKALLSGGAAAVNGEAIDTEAGDRGIPTAPQSSETQSLVAMKSLMWSHSDAKMLSGTLTAGSAHPVPQVSMHTQILLNTPAAATFSICGSVIGQTPPPPNPAIWLCSDNGPLDAFLNILASASWEFSGTPPIQGNSATAYILSPTYDWMYWLQNGTDVQTMTVTLEIDRGLARVIQIDANVALFGGMVFSSVATLSNTQASPAAASPPVNDSFLIDPSFLVLGLNLTTPMTGIAITTILQTFAPPWLSATADLLPGFGGDITFNLGSNNPVFPAPRNCLFFDPDAGYQTHLRLQFIADKSTLTSLGSSLSFLGGSTTVTDLALIIKKAVKQTGGVSPSTTTIQTDYDVHVCAQVTVRPGLNFTVWFNLDADTTSVVIDFQSTPDINDVLAWLASISFTEVPSDFLPANGFASCELHQIKLSLPTPQSNSFGALDRTSWAVTATFEVVLFNTLFLICINWMSDGSVELRGDLWQYQPMSPLEFSFSLYPEFETYKLVYPFPVNADNATGSLSLTSFNSTMTSLPLGINLEVESASLDVQLANGTKSLSVAGEMSASLPTTVDVPPVELLEIDLIITWTESTGSASVYDIRLGSIVYLLPRGFDITNSAMYAAKFEVEMDYSSDGIFTLEADATDLQFAALYSLFDADAKESTMDMLEHFSIPELKMQYTFQSGSTELLLSGTILLGPLEFSIAYDYLKSGGATIWSVDAQLYVTTGADLGGQVLTLSKLIETFDPNSEFAWFLEDVPFIGTIGIPAVNVDSDASGGSPPEDAPLSLHVGKTDHGLVMWFRIEIDTEAGALSLLFVQFSVTGQSSSTGSHMKRLLRVELNKLPQFPNIPIVGHIDQPIDSLQYLFVQDIDGATAMAAGTANAASGFTQAEIDAVNSQLPASDVVQFRDVGTGNASGGAKPSAGPVYVLLAGHHFVAIVEEKVVIDHIFGQSTKPSTPANAPPLAPNPDVVERWRVQQFAAATSSSIAKSTEDGSTSQSITQSDSGTTMGASGKTFGPLTLSNVGIQCKDDHLFIVLDATIALGPIQFSLLGFGLGLPLKVGATGQHVTFNNLSQLSIDDFIVELSGLNVYMNIPPVLVAGFFRHVIDATSESYLGGLTVGIEAYVVLAVGEYQHTFSPADFKSVFLFGRLDGPLLELEFAEISGVEVGFGYNYDIRLPQPSQVYQYPLVHGAASSDNPMALLDSSSDSTSFTYWQTAEQEKYWFAIGMKIDSFQIITADAAAVFAFGAGELKIGLVGMASATLPPVRGEKPPEAFVYAELGIVASLDVFGGSLVIGAQLTPNSYVLAPDCHLMGGFGLGYWFGNSPYAGDWVFSIGGFHPAFNPPSYYFVPDRVGISWQLSDVLSITGEAFFAICPKACMAGGRLDAVFNCGPVYAEFIAYAQFLVNFKPFFFIGDMGLSVEVGFHGDIGLIHINIHAEARLAHLHKEVDAELHMHGPPVAGTVYVDLWIHKFSIDFGPQNSPPPPLSWSEFLQVVQKPGPGASDTTGFVVVAIGDGTASDKTAATTQTPGTVWYVRASSFTFRVECKIPLNTLTYGDGIVSWTTDTAINPKPIYARLMHTLTPLTSNLVVKVRYMDYGTPPLPADDKENPWNLNPSYKNLPIALWQKYDPSNDPVAAGNSISSVLSSSTASSVSQLIGFHFTPPLPRLPTDNLPEFNATAAMLEDVFPDAIIPPSADQRPHLPATPPLQISDLAASRISGDPWDEVAAAWGKADVGVGRVVLNSFAALLGWNLAQAPMASTAPVSGTATVTSDGNVNVSGITLEPAASGSSTTDSTTVSNTPAKASTMTAAASPTVSSATTTANTVPALGTAAVGASTAEKQGLAFGVPTNLLGEFDQYYLSAPYMAQSLTVDAAH